MKKLSKRMATIVGTVLLAVIIVASVTFAFAQKKDSVASTFFSDNMTALAQTEGSGTIKNHLCFFKFSSMPKAESYECSSTSQNFNWIIGPCWDFIGNYSVSKCSKDAGCIAALFSDWGYCYTPN